MLPYAMVASSRRAARFLAPIALAAVIGGTYVIVHSTLTAKHGGAGTARTVTRESPQHRKYRKVIFYVVQPGDSLTSIAAKTGIPLATLSALNPTVDPNALQTGQRLRLRRR